MQSVILVMLYRCFVFIAQGQIMVIATPYIVHLASTYNAYPDNNCHPGTIPLNQFQEYTCHLVQGESHDHNLVCSCHRGLARSGERLCSFHRGTSCKFHRHDTGHQDTELQLKQDLKIYNIQPSHRTTMLFCSFVILLGITPQ